MDTFLIREDPVQVDRWLFRIRARLAKYKEQNSFLEEEITQLRNRPDDIYNPPRKKDLVVKGSANKINMDAPIEKWNSHHFIRYFQEKFFDLYHKDFKVRGNQWRVYAIRIKQFKDSHPEIQDNQNFKSMIDWLFTKFNRKFIASIPLITSDNMLCQWTAATSGRIPTSSAEFKKIAAQVPKTKKETDDIIGSF